MAWIAVLAMDRAGRRGVPREPARVLAAARAAVLLAMDQGRDAVREQGLACVKAWGQERVVDQRC